MKIWLSIIALVVASGLLAEGTRTPQAIQIVSKPGESELTITVPTPGLYRFSVSSRSKVPIGTEHLGDFQWDGGVWRHRQLIPYYATDGTYRIDRIQFSTEPHKLKYRWDDKKLEVLSFQFELEKPVPIPTVAQNYQPKAVPLPNHPRLLVNPEILEKIRSNLEVGENRKLWLRLQKKAETPFKLECAPDQELQYDTKVISTVSAKAFYYLMKGDRNLGREAVELMTDYLDRLNLGNDLMASRCAGEIIFTVAQVYDWCYDLASLAELTRIREKMLFWAASLEIGWPPFRQSIARGHGNEAQISRDLLAMAIAIYNEDPEPFRYTAYTVFEVLQPVVEFMCKSGRHDQGSSYGTYRWFWDLYAALQIRRSCGVELLPPEAAQLPYYWHYQRLPDYRYLPEGDANWKWLNEYECALDMLLASLALWPDPELKQEMRRADPKAEFPYLDPVFVLLTNDPTLKPEDRRSSMPLTKIYQKPLPGMVARTGWNFGLFSDDVMVEMQGADYHYRNHQHLDLGSFQIYFRGNLAVDLGQYTIYGCPFDWNFTKSTVSHSAMLFRDPKQKKQLMGSFFTANSGGQEIKEWVTAPDLKTQLTGNDYRCGDTPRAGFGPDANRPIYSFLETDLGMLYPNRVKSYSRSFVFLNLGREDTPATLLVLDRFEKASDPIEPIFQLNSFDKPIEKAGILEIRSSLYGRTGKLSVQTLLPQNPTRKIYTGDDTFTVGGTFFTPFNQRAVATSGCRTEITGSGKVFLNLIQIQDGEAKPLPATCTERNGRILTTIGNDWLVGLGNALKVDSEKLEFEVTTGEKRVLLLDLAPGIWELRQRGKGIGRTTVSTEQGNFFAVLSPGSYELALASNSQAPELTIPELKAEPARALLRNGVLMAGKALDDVSTQPAKTAGDVLVPMAKLAPQSLSNNGAELRITCRAGEISMHANDREVKIGDLRIKLEKPLVANEFLLPSRLAARLLDMRAIVDERNGTVLMERDERPCDILLVNAGSQSTGLWRLLDGSAKEWSANGSRVQVEILLLRPRELSEVALRWACGTTQKSSFLLEVSPDGVNYSKVFDGTSSGKSADFEPVTFSKRKVQALRFMFRGSQMGKWNRLTGLRLGGDGQ